MIPAWLSSEQIAAAYGCTVSEVEDMAATEGWEKIDTEWVDTAVVVLQEATQALEHGTPALLVWLEIIRKSGVKVPQNFTAHFKGKPCTIRKIAQVARANRWGCKKDQAAIIEILSEIQRDADRGHPWVILCVDVMRMCGFPLPNSVDVWIEVIRQSNVVTLVDE